MTLNLDFCGLKGPLTFAADEQPPFAVDDQSGGLNRNDTVGIFSKDQASSDRSTTAKHVVVRHLPHMAGISPPQRRFVPYSAASCPDPITRLGRDVLFMPSPMP